MNLAAASKIRDRIPQAEPEKMRFAAGEGRFKLKAFVQGDAAICPKLGQTLATFWAQSAMLSF